MDNMILNDIKAQLCDGTGGVYIADEQDGCIVYVNTIMKQMLGLDATGKTCAELVGRNPHMRELFRSNANDGCNDWEYYDITAKKMYKLRAVVVGAGEKKYRAVTADDITEMLELNCEVTDYLRLMNAISEMQTELIENQDNTVGTLVKSLVNRFSVQAVYVSLHITKSKLRLWSLKSGETQVTCQDTDELPATVREIEPYAIRAAERVYEFRVITGDTSEIWEESREIVMSMAGVYLESAVLREQIQWENSHDKFTGLYNRAHYIITASRLYENLDSVGVIFLDIDNLKKVNDEQGHHMGDMLIKKAADVLHKYVTDTTDAYRMGGDEFMLICCNCEVSDMVERVSKIRQSVERENEYVPEPLLQISMGYAFSDSIEDMEAIVKEADSRMYAEKQRHKRGRTV